MSFQQWITLSVELGSLPNVVTNTNLNERLQCFLKCSLTNILWGEIPHEQTIRQYHHWYSSISICMPPDICLHLLGIFDMRDNCLETWNNMVVNLWVDELYRTCQKSSLEKSVRMWPGRDYIWLIRDPKLICLFFLSHMSQS